MDDVRFDRLARLLAGPASRRSALGGLLAGVVLPLLPEDETTAAPLARRRKQDRDREPEPDVSADKKRKRRRKKKCKPASAARTCAGKCGSVKNNCKKSVDCGSCACDPLCGACLVCQDGPNTPGTCVPDPTRQGQACGNAGQFCQTDGTCACDADSCAAGEHCCPGGCIAWSNQTTFGSEGSDPDQFQTPYGVALSGDARTAWVADYLSHRIAVWTRPTGSSTNWSYLTSIGGGQGSGPSQFQIPLRVAVSPDERTIWVADSVNNRISVWSRPTGNSTDWTNQTTFGSEGSDPDQFQRPWGVAVSADELTVWVVDQSNHRISVWTRPDTNSTSWSNQTTFGSQGSDPDQFEGPYDVAVSADARTVWVTDQNNNRISVWTRSTSSSTDWNNQATFGSQGTGPSEFRLPEGVAVSADGLTVWVAEYGNTRVSVWARPDSSSTAWSNQTTFGSEGSGPSEFLTPVGVAVSADGLTVVVADQNNARISVWTQACPA